MYVSSNHIIYELKTTSFSDRNLEFGITDGDIFHFVYKDALDVV